jgi:hypothetical protein
MLVLKVDRGKFDAEKLIRRYSGCMVTLETDGKNTLIKVNGLKVRLSVEQELLFVESCRLFSSAPTHVHRRKQGSNSKPAPTHVHNREGHGGFVQPTLTHVHRGGQGGFVQPTSTHMHSGGQGGNAKPAPTHMHHREGQEDNAKPAPTYMHHEGNHKQKSNGPTIRQGPTLSQGAWLCPKSYNGN